MRQKIYQQNGYRKGFRTGKGQLSVITSSSMRFLRRSTFLPPIFLTPPSTKSKGFNCLINLVQHRRRFAIVRGFRQGGSSEHNHDNFYRMPGYCNIKKIYSSKQKVDETNPIFLLQVLFGSITICVLPTHLLKKELGKGGPAFDEWLMKLTKV